MRRLFTSAAVVIAALMAASSASAQHYPNMVYSSPQELAPGVTYRTGSQNSPSSQRIYILEIDMENPNVELRAVFKRQGDIGGALNETTSSMAIRSDAVGAVNAGFFVTAAGDYLRMTNSYTEIDGVYIGGSATNSNIAQGGRSLIGFSGNRQETAIRTKLTNAGNPNPANPNWALITDAIAGRGHFTWDGTTSPTNYTVDIETTADPDSHSASRHPRTLIGISQNPYRAYLVAVDGRTSVAVGMTFTELARLMADLGVEQSVSLDGGGSTAMWTQQSGIVNVPSDGTERANVSSWVVVTQNTMDNTVDGVTVTGSWTTDTTSSEKYHVDHLVSAAGPGTDAVEWRPDLGEDGEYRVYTWYASDPGRSQEVPYEIEHADGTVTVSVDQTKNGRRWILLGHYNFNAGTAGSVTVSNTAAGTVSADAVRFVRHRATPPAHDADYDVLSTVFQTDFETDESANFTTAQRTAGDSSINFSYDYSLFSQQGGGHPTTIPPAPNSDSNGTRGLRVATNLANGAVNGITATLNSNAIPTGLSNFRMTVDAWINYNGGMDGGTGSTEFMSFGASANPALVAYAASSYGGAHNPFSGFYFAMTGEGGGSANYRYHDGAGGAATGNNASRVNYLGTAASEPTAFGRVFPLSSMYETNGVPGKAWHTWEVISLNGQLRLSIIRPDGSHVILADWFTPSPGVSLTNLRPHLGTFDPYASLANPGSDNFVVYDNLVVQQIQAAAPVSVPEWSLY